MALKAVDPLFAHINFLREQYFPVYSSKPWPSKQSSGRKVPRNWPCRPPRVGPVNDNFYANYNSYEKKKLAVSSTKGGTGMCVG